MGEGKVLVCWAHGQGLVLVYRADSIVTEWIQETQGSSDNTFDLTDVEYVDGPRDGLWTYELSLEDDGPGDWPGTREYRVVMSDPVPTTADEWAHHCDGEWPWDPFEEEPKEPPHG